MHMPTKPKMYRLNAEIADALKAYCKKERERETALVERIIKEFLRSQNAWPPKGTK